MQNLGIDLSPAPRKACLSWASFIVGLLCAPSFGSAQPAKPMASLEQPSNAKTSVAKTMALDVKTAERATESLTERRAAEAWSEDAEVEYQAAMAAVRELKVAQTDGHVKANRQAFHDLRACIRRITQLLGSREPNGARRAPPLKRKALMSRMRRMAAHLNKLRQHAQNHGVALDATRAESALAKVREARGADRQPARLFQLTEVLRREIEDVQVNMLSAIRAVEL